MKISYLRQECAIVVDGVTHNVPQLRDLAAYIRAIHFDDKVNRGYIEYIPDSAGRPQPTQQLRDAEDFKPYAVMLDYWREKEAAAKDMAKTRDGARDDAERESAKLS